VIVAAIPLAGMSTRNAAVLVLLFSIALYLPSAWNGFAYDDNPVIRMDPRIHDLAAAWQLFLQPYWLIEDLGLYRPLASLSYAIDWAISGGRPAWFHVVNIVWNAAACVLVFAVLRWFVPVVVALAAALVFAVHPVHVEAVANVVGRAELMAAVFTLSAALIWLRTDPGQPSSHRHTVAIAVLYCLALLSKESAIVLPALLALFDVARGSLRPDTMRAWLAARAPAFAVLTVVVVPYLLLRRTVLGTLGPGLVDPTLDVATTWPERVMTALQAWPEIMRLFFFPRTLLAEYGPPYLMPALTLNVAVVAGALILLSLVAGGLLAFRYGHGRAAFVLLFAPVALLPASNLVIPIGVIVAERALYLPSLAVVAAFAFGMHAWTAGPTRRAAMLVVIPLVGIFAVRTLQRIPEWDSTEAVLGALLRDQPDSYRAHWHFAGVAREAGDVDAAMMHYARALSVWPFREGLTLEATAYAVQQGNIGMASQVTRFAVGRWPGDVRFLRIHAGLLLDAGNTGQALQVIEQALLLAPEDSTLHAMHAAAVVTP
jgi:protein O-mannosyl-transferase